MAGRAAFVFPLSFLINLVKKSPKEKINFRQQVVIWWAGLMRGAVSIALAYNQFTRSGHTQLRGNAIMITSTITVVRFSTVMFGLLTKPLIRFLLPHPRRTASKVQSDPSTPKSVTVPFLGEGQDSVPLLGEGQDSEFDLPEITRPSSIHTCTPGHSYAHCSSVLA